MDPRRKDVEEVITPDKTPKGSEEQSKPPKHSGNIRKEKKKKKPMYKLRKLMASFWWIASIATLVVGSIGLINLILSLYLRGGPDWNYVLIVTTLGRDVQMIVYGFEGHKRNLIIRMQDNVSYYGNFEEVGAGNEFKNNFEKAEQMIPWLSRSSSPVLFAGAGDLRYYRKYNRRFYDIFMRNISKLFNESSLKVLPNSVRTLEDWEEPLYGWVALNYLSDTLTKGRPPIKSKRDLFTTRKTFGYFDWGQTSLHVSYEVPRVLDNTKFPPGVRVITLFGRVYYVYTQTFPCSGSTRIVDKYFTYRYDDKNRTGPHGKFLTLYYIKHGKFSPAYCYNDGNNDHPDNFTQSGQLRKVDPTHMDHSFRNYSPYYWMRHLFRPCSIRDTMEKRRKVDFSGLKEHAWMYYNGEHDPEACEKEVEEMITNCSGIFKYYEECPVFTTPKRPYDVPFIMSNEVGLYADMAGIKDGDPKEVWKKKREEICKINGTLNVMAKFPSRNGYVWTTIRAGLDHYKNLCLVITYLDYVLKALNLTDTERSYLRVQGDIGHNRVAWQLGYAMNATNALPTDSPYHVVFTIEEIFIQMLVYAGILSFSSLALSLALRNSNTLATRPLELPQQEDEINERYFRQFIQNKEV